LLCENTLSLEEHEQFSFRGADLTREVLEPPRPYNDQMATADVDAHAGASRLPQEGYHVH
jgi:hypothetical protein